MAVGDVTLDVGKLVAPATVVNPKSFTLGPNVGNAKTFVLTEADLKLEEWRLKINNTNVPIEKARMVVRFTLK